MFARLRRNQARGSSVCASVKIAENEMHNLTCAACGRGLVEASAWKGRAKRFYCNDFCAEAEEAESSSLVPSMAAEPQLATTSRGSV
jgi:hypothetical protein